MILEMAFGGRAQLPMVVEQRSSGWLNNWGEILGGEKTNSGVSVTADSALRTSAVLACVRVLAETVAALPLHVYRRTGNGKDRASDLPLYQVLHAQPNQWQTSFEFREMMMAHLVLRGNAYAEIIAGQRGSADQLVPMHPDRMGVERLTNGRLRYAYTLPGERPTYYTQDEMFHVRWMSVDGLVGLNPIQLAREPIGLATVTEAHGAALFRNRAEAGVVLRHPGKLSPAAAENLRASWERVHKGTENAHRTAVLEEGMDAKSLGMTSEDAQFIESRKFQISEIARIFRVPPHLIGDLEHATFSNIEHSSIEFVKFTMLPWLVRWEQAIWRDLIADPEFFAEFLVAGLERGDLASRSQAYATGRQWGWYSINDIRAMENMNPIGEGGDVYLSPQNMFPADKINEWADKQLEPAPKPEPQLPVMQQKIDEQDERIRLLGQAALEQSLGCAAAEARVELYAVEHKQKCLESAVAVESRLAAERLAFGHELAREAAEKERDRASLELAESRDKLAAQEEEARKVAAERDRAQAQAEAQKAEADRKTDELRVKDAELRQVVGKLDAMHGIESEAYGLLGDAARRMIRWEVDAARRATKKKNFVAEIDTFYATHAERMQEAFRHSKRELADPIARHVEESQRLLLEVAGQCTAKDLVAGVEACVVDWESSRVEALVGKPLAQVA